MNMNKAIEDLHDAEAELAKRLRVTGERHASESDIYHLGHTLARQCDEHLRALAPFADRYGAKPAPDDVDASPGLLETVRRRTAAVVGRTESAGLLLMADLRELYLAAQHAELAWVVLLQAAKARRDAELIEVVTSCHEQTEMCGKWLRTRIKEAAPQVYAAG
jgi:Cft2 family RNA processing exonuclease